MVLVAPQGFTSVANKRLLHVLHSDTLKNTLTLKRGFTYRFLWHFFAPSRAAKDVRRAGLPLLRDIRVEPRSYQRLPNSGCQFHSVVEAN